MNYNNIYQFYCQHLYVKPKNTCQRVSGWFWVEYNVILMLKWEMFLGLNMILSSLSHIRLCSCDFDPASCLTVGAAFFGVADSTLRLVSCAYWLLTPALWRGACVGDLTSLLCLVANSCPPEIQRDPNLLKVSCNPLKKTMEVQILLRIIIQYGNDDDEQRWSSGVSAGISNCELISNYIL